MAFPVGWPTLDTDIVDATDTDNADPGKDHATVHNELAEALNDLSARCKVTRLSGSGNKTTTSTTRTPIDSTNLGYLTLDLAVGNIVEITIFGTWLPTANITAVDFEVDQPTSANVYSSTDCDKGAAAMSNGSGRQPYTVRDVFTATEAGVHGFRPVWFSGTASTSTLYNGASGNDDSVVVFSVRVIG